MVATSLYFDTATVYYRAFFAVPESVKAPDGTPSGAVRGFLDMVSAFVKANPSEEIVFAWDTDWRPDWRVKLLPSYKAHRVDEDSVETGFELIPDTLSPQISAIAQIVDAIGLVRVGQTNFEADDVLGSLVYKKKKNCRVVTGDRDLFQLVDDKQKVTVISMNKGMKNLEFITDKYLLDKYGIIGSQYVDFACLRGDPSDGLPGIKGVGEKTAAKLICDFGSLKKLIDAAHKENPIIKPGTRMNILNSLEYLEKAQKVVSVRTDMSLPKNLSRPLKIKNKKELQLIAHDWGAGNHLNRLLGALDLPPID